MGKKKKKKNKKKGFKQKKARTKQKTSWTGMSMLFTLVKALGVSNKAISSREHFYALARSKIFITR